MKSGHCFFSLKRTCCGSAYLDRRHVVFHQLMCRAVVALERELYILGSDRLAIVEFDPLAQDKFITEPVRSGRPRLGEARRLGFAGHRLHHCVVQRVQHHVGGDNPFRLGRIEPGRSQRYVNGPGQLAAGCGRQTHAGSPGDQPEGAQSQHLPTRQAGFVGAADWHAAAVEKRTHKTPPDLGYLDEPCAKGRPPLRKCLDFSGRSSESRLVHRGAAMRP